MCVFHYDLATTKAFANKFSIPDERNNTRNILLEKISRLSPSYVVKFDFKPRYFQDGYTNILHLTASRDDCCKQGDRIPGIWFHGASANSTYNKLLICSAVNGLGNYCVDSKPNIPRGKWTTVEVSQRPEGAHYIYQVKVGGVLLASMINDQPRYYARVKVYGSDKWYNTAEGSMRNLVIDPNAEGKVPNPVYASSCEVNLTSG